MWTSERPADETDCYPGVWPPHRGTTAATTGENSCRRPAGVVDVCQLPPTSGCGRAAGARKCAKDMQFQQVGNIVLRA